MLKTCSSVLLLTKDRNLSDLMQEIAFECDFRLRVESEWCKNYRVQEQIVICDSSFVKDINAAFIKDTRVVLAEGESFVAYKDIIDSFIFDYNDIRQLYYAILVETSEEKEPKLDSFGTVFLTERYSFDFTRNRFLLDGRGIYLTKSEKEYLFDWLLRGKKDNNKRIKLFNMRKKFGKDFLADINRRGEKRS